MRTLSATVAALALTAAAFSFPAVAQTQSTPGAMPPSIPAPASTPNLDKAPPIKPSPSAQNQPNQKDEMTTSTAMTPDADAGAMSGKRVSRIIGTAVVNDKDETIGKVDDILIGRADKATTAVISVGGFLGIGAKLVAVPFDQLTPAANDRKSLTMPNASKESLKSMPAFNYGNGA
jgi:hypothetical protein